MNKKKFTLTKQTKNNNNSHTNKKITKNKITPIANI